MQSTLTISSKLLGKSKSLFPDWTISLPAEILSQHQKLTLRDLLTYIVTAEVENFHIRQEEQRLTRVLTQVEIEWGKRQGKIDMGGKYFQQEVDTQIAINTVLQAFEDGFYYIFINDIQQENLETEIDLKPDSQVLFLRLAPLVGG